LPKPPDRPWDPAGVRDHSHE